LWSRYIKALSPNPRRKTVVGADNLGLGHLLLLDFWKVRLAIGEEKKKSVAKARLFSFFNG